MCASSPAAPAHGSATSFGSAQHLTDALLRAGPDGVCFHCRLTASFMAAWQSKNSLVFFFSPSLGIVFLRGYLDTDQNLAQFQPGQAQPHKSSHQGKLSSLRDVPWPRCYLHIFIFITVAHRGWAETKVPWHFTLCTHKNPDPSSKGCCSQLTLYTTVRWLAQSPPVSSQTQNLPAGQSEQHPPKQILNLFFPNKWKFGQICHCVLLLTLEKQPSLGHLSL